MLYIHVPWYCRTVVLSYCYCLLLPAACYCLRLLLPANACASCLLDHDTQSCYLILLLDHVTWSCYLIMLLDHGTWSCYLMGTALLGFMLRSDPLPTTVMDRSTIVYIHIYIFYFFVYMYIMHIYIYIYIESLTRMPPGQAFRKMGCVFAGLLFVDVLWFLASCVYGLTGFERIFFFNISTKNGTNVDWK